MPSSKLISVIALIFVSFALAPCAFPQAESAVSVPTIAPAEVARAWQDIFATPPSLTLIPKSPQAHPGKIWVRSAPDGLHVWGKVDADQPNFRWPQQKSEMLSSEHVEVWLATSADVSMPAPGWGNQFGAIELGSLKDCAEQRDPHNGDAESGSKDCERWYDEQLSYRQNLRRLFVRQWLISGSQYSGSAHLFEEFASSAFSTLYANLFPEDLPQALKPKYDSGVTAEFAADTRPEEKHDAAGRPYKYYAQIGYHFHLFIPYSAFPPAQQLRLSHLYFMVDVFSSAPAGRKMGDFSSTSAARQWGQPSTFNHLVLASPRNFSITPCGYQLEQSDLYGELHPSWFFPTQPEAGDSLHSTFALINPAGGYMYAPAGVSPESPQADFFWKQMADGAFACGPHLSWRSGNAINRSKFVVDPQRFEAKTFPDGWTLLLSGPTASTLSTFGSGACGSCLVMGFGAYAVSPQGEISSALSINEPLTAYGGQPSSADLSISPDWTQIILYREFINTDQPDEGPSWTSTAYCLDGHSYKQCAESKNVHPPDPAKFKEFRQQE